MDVKDLIEKLLGEIDTISKTETVVGEPLMVGELKLIPISKLSIGFGVGGMTSQAARGAEADEVGGELGGAGGGIRVQPVAFIAVDPAGSAQLLCLDEPEATVIDKLLHVAPDLLDKVLNRLRRERTTEPALAEADDEKTG